MKYKVIQDTREKNGWWFGESDHCNGTEKGKLDTGDYSIEGFEKEFVIERKATTAEISKNINEKRFDAELQRLEQYKNPFIICEFTLDDVLNFPQNSGIPKNAWPQLKVTNYFILKKLTEYSLLYKTKIIYAGQSGKMMAACLFKRVMNDGR